MSPQAVWENFRDALANHYFDMQGRVSRARFWYFVLACTLVGLAAVLASIITLLPLSNLLGLALLLPMAGMGARRLQDRGRDGRLVWALIVPSAILQVVAILALASGPFGVMGFLAFFFSVGWMLNILILLAAMVLIYFWVQPGDASANAYGPAPDSVTILPPT